MTIIYFILVLGITILIHELGHFLFAKKAGIYVYEFSIGMGPRIFTWHRKNDETTYSVRLFPIGGFVAMAGEDMETDKEIPVEKQMCNKPWIKRVLVVVAGVLFNFLLAIILLFVVGMISGVPSSKPVIGVIDPNYPLAKTNLQVGDEIVKINHTKVHSIDRLSLELSVYNGKTIDVTVKHSDGAFETIPIEPKKVKVDKEEGYKYGFGLASNVKHGFLVSLKYAFEKTFSLIGQMLLILFYLITGKLSINNLAGPVGIFNVVSASAAAGLINLVYLTAYLCINVGIINIIPLPAFDGGRLLFMIIEKIKGSKVNPKIENMVHNIGFFLLMLLMVVITWNDLMRIFK